MSEQEQGIRNKERGRRPGESDEAPTTVFARGELPSGQAAPTSEPIRDNAAMAATLATALLSEAAPMLRRGLVETDEGVAHLLRCASAGLLRTASKGESAAFLLCQTLLHQLPLMSQVDALMIRGLGRLLAVANTGFEGRVIVRQLLTEKGGVEE